MNIILIAPPAAGKGTQANNICSKYHLKHISTGDLLRGVTKKNDEYSNKIKELMNKGLLISDDIILDLIKEEIKDSDGFIFDGFPRNIAQAESFDRLLNSLDKKIDYVIYLDIDKETAQARITGRYTCSSCNNIYNIKDNTKLCPSCGGELYQRKDDNIETFNKRYDVYMNETEPVLTYYRDKNILYEVDSSQEPDKVFQDIEEVIS